MRATRAVKKVCFIVLLLGTSVLVDAAPASAATVVVTLSPGGPSPASITVTAGDRIKFVASGPDVLHAVAADNGAFGTDIQECRSSHYASCIGTNNGEFQDGYITPALAAGTYGYAHRVETSDGGSDHRGTITVQAPPPPTTAAPATTTKPVVTTVPAAVTTVAEAATDDSTGTTLAVVDDTTTTSLATTAAASSSDDDGAPVGLILVGAVALAALGLGGAAFARSRRSAGPSA